MARINKKWGLVALLIAVALAFFTYQYMYQDHRNIAEEEAAFTVDAKQLIAAFTSNTDGANAKFLDKTIEVKGIVSSIDTKYFVLNESIDCYTDSVQLSTVTKGKALTIKGRCIGYDDLFATIKLDQVSVKK